MLITKRNGTTETVKLEKITRRITRLCKDLKNIDPIVIAQKVIQGLYDGVTSKELDTLAIEMSYSMSVKHPDYDKLALRLAVSSLHKDTPSSFSEVITELYNAKDAWGNNRSIIADDIYKIVIKHKHILDNAINYDRDYLFDYFGYKTLEKSYLLKINKWNDGNHTQEIIERPQHMWMRVAIGIHKKDIDAALKTYEMLSKLEATHATPTLFNAGTVKNQLSSCFLIQTKADSVSGIYDTIKECALISQTAGGIGVHIHDVRSKGSPIYGTGGTSNGIVPMLKNFNETARYIDQCFAGDTIVYTSSGPSKIKDICVGDDVLGGSGIFNKVTKTFKTKKTGKVLVLSTEHTLKETVVSHVHPFLAIKGQNDNFILIKNRLDNNLIKPEWIDAQNLSVGDMIAFPISNNEIDLDYTNDDCVFYGLMLKCGDVFKDDDCCLNLDSQIYADFALNYLKFNGIKSSFQFNKNNYNITWKACSSFKFSKAMLYDDKGMKKIHKSMLHLPKEKTLSILSPLTKIDKEKCFIKLPTLPPAPQLIEPINYMLMRFGILTFNNAEDASQLFYHPLINSFVYKNLAYSKITAINEKHIDEVIYDLEVEPDHNYVTHIGLAHNGGGRRKGSFAIYLEPWHADIEGFLDLRKNNGKEELRARDLNIAIWAPDLFFQRVKDDGDWTLMDPNVCKGLSDVYGEKFNELYQEYEAKNLGERTVKARHIWAKILESCIETGEPYILAKDACNIKSNQKNIGTIKSSNLCAEIIEYSDAEHTSVCNLSSISLPACITGKKQKTFDFDKLYNITCTLTENINKIIDIEYYPTETTKRSNLRERPIGIGIQGLATAFCILRYPFDSEEAAKLNKDIAETMYYAAVKTSCELAKVQGSYKTFKGSPMSKGQFQFDLWNVKPSDRYDWEALRKDVMEFGVANSLFIAEMPTASCFHVETPITLADNSVRPLKDILIESGIDVDLIEKIDQPMSLALSAPVKVKTLEGEGVSKVAHYNGYKHVCDVEFEDGSVYSFTENHQLLVNRNNEKVWVKVIDLQDGDDIVDV